MNLFSRFVEKTHTDKGRRRKIVWKAVTIVLAAVIDGGLDEVKIGGTASRLIYFEGQSDRICRHVCLGV